MRLTWACILAAVIGLLAALNAHAEPLPFEPGERLHLQVTCRAIDVGSLDVRVGESTTPGDPTWPITLSARAEGAFASVSDLEETFVSRFDPVTRRSAGTELRELAGGTAQAEQVRFDVDTASVHRESGGRVEEAGKFILPGAMDVLAAIYRIRTLDLSPGAVHAIPIFTGRQSWPMTVRVAGRGKITVPAGELEAIRLVGRTHFGGRFASDRDVTVWISADAARVPLRVEAEIAAGPIVAELTAFEPHAPVATASR